MSFSLFKARIHRTVVVKGTHPVDDALTVDVCQTGQQLPHNLQSRAAILRGNVTRFQWNSTTYCRAVVLQMRGQRPACQQSSGSIPPGLSSSTCRKVLGQNSICMHSICCGAARLLCVVCVWVCVPAMVVKVQCAPATFKQRRHCWGTNEVGRSRKCEHLQCPVPLMP